MSESQFNSNSTQTGTAAPKKVDPRGPRFGAAVTAVVLILALLFGPSSPVTLGLLILQTIAFALGGLVGLQYQPYGFIYSRLVRPRLQPPAELEDVRPPQFAQLVGLVFALLALIGYLAGLSVLFYAALILALVAALLNAVFNFCLGCEIYLLAARLGKKA
ncbi:MAG: DUF4395 domain-containing protein [Candidatus Nanopelagicales bacterium]